MWSLAPHTCISLTCLTMKSQRQKEGTLNSDQDFMSYIVLKLLSVFWCQHINLAVVKSDVVTLKTTFFVLKMWITRIVSLRFNTDIKPPTIRSLDDCSTTWATAAPLYSEGKNRRLNESEWVNGKEMLSTQVVYFLAGTGGEIQVLWKVLNILANVS